MNSIIATALSGLDAARKRLEVSAANIANVDSEGALPDAGGPDSNGGAGAPQPYTPLSVSQQPLVTGGTVATTQPVDPPVFRRYAPNASYANRDGLVASPNVDLVSEGINQLTASRAYEANARVLKIGLDLERETIDALGSRKRVNFQT
jgi:flagellar basal-body rod protein FlgC